MAVQIRGFSGNLVEVDVSRNMHVKLPDASTPATVGAIGMYSVNDLGTHTGGTKAIKSPETTQDYRLRQVFERLLDNETFNYAAQNTGKYTYANTTMTATWSAAGITTNATSITTTATGLTIGSYAEFPLAGAAATYCEFTAGFSALFQANVVIDFGLFRRGASTAYAPTDGVYFRYSAAGLSGISCFNTVETGDTGAFAGWVPTLNKKYNFTITLNEKTVEYWIDDELWGSIITPSGQGQPCISATLPWSVRQAHPGVAGSVVQMQITDVAVSQDSPSMVWAAQDMGNVLYGGYQGLSGGTMGSLANYANSANPAAAVPTNTTAALGSGFGGQFWETDTLAANTDGIISSYQIPAGTVAIQGRRCYVYGVKISSYVQTVLTGGGYNAQWSLAWGHTAVSLATPEAATTKAPRRKALGAQSVAAALAALSSITPEIARDWKAPVVVNPGEFIQTVKKKVGTAPSGGVIAHTVDFDYGWGD